MFLNILAALTLLLTTSSCDNGPSYADLPIVTPGGPNEPEKPMEREEGSLAGWKKLMFDSPFEGAVKTYWLVNADKASEDPVSWSLWGSNDQKEWTKVDERTGQTFLSRYTEKECVVKEPGVFSKYALVVAMPGNDTLTRLEPYGIRFFDRNLAEGWEDFRYPSIEFNDMDPGTEGSKIYKELVPDPVKYIQYHAQKVCEILFWTADNPSQRYDISKITYNLKNYDGISAKSGAPPHITINFSTRHVENTVGRSIAEFSEETRGVLFHEITHGYQHEPKGCGNYDGKSEFWAVIEGMADAVRIDAGYHSSRKPTTNGNWMTGYTTTGFFLQWFRTKDPDALRKFHDTMRTVNPWSFDAGVKEVFGPETTIQGLWDEYVAFINSNPGYHHYTE